MTKAVVITGVNRGLGHALIEKLQESDMHIIALSRNFTREQQAAQKEQQLHLITCDLSNAKDLRMAMNEVVRHITIADLDELYFINNASTVEPIAEIGDLDPERVTAAVAVNLTAPILIANALCKLAQKRVTHFTVVNISTGAANHPIRGLGLYCATKSGAAMFFDVLGQQDVANKKVRVYQIDPGVMETRMQDELRGADEKRLPTRGYFISVKENRMLKNPENVAAKILEEVTLR
ncbi:MAG: SDR family NAD(P)-dependent oxidoreductase [Actinobacteria bacterium]|nr:SDR family NAD(P)-dependent oxidoreductase [Actinomycetota bacterium]